MSRKAMSLKAKIRNIAKEKELPAQIILQNYMFERFIERLSISEYKEKFILKGGVLIASLVGLDNRATMDVDTTIKNYPLNINSVTTAITDICKIEIKDDVNLVVTGVVVIRDDDIYGGYRVSIRADYETINTPMHVDVTTGDIITPKEIMYEFKKNFSDGTITVLTYNIETVLAEKVETILRRGELNTRPRDFYDVFILSKTQSFDKAIFFDALKGTAVHRETTFIFNNTFDRIDEIQKSSVLLMRWEKYTKEYHYAKEISYTDVMIEIKKLFEGIIK